MDTRDLGQSGCLFLITLPRTYAAPRLSVAVAENYSRGFTNIHPATKSMNSCSRLNRFDGVATGFDRVPARYTENQIKSYNENDNGSLYLADA